MDVNKLKKDTKTARQNSFGWMLKTLCTRFDNRMIKELKKHDLNLGQFAIIMTLSEGDGITQTEIGKRISMPGYATTRNIDVLENKALLERQKDESSRRSFSIQLTEKGKALGPSLFSIVKEINESALAPLTEQEEQQLKVLLQKMLFDNV